MSSVASHKISAGQLTALLLTGRLAVSMTFAPAPHQLSHGTDFLLSLVLEGGLLALLLLPTWWFRKETGGIGIPDYCRAVLGRAGGIAAAVFYAVVCLYVQVSDLLRFGRFVETVLSPDMSVTALCTALMIAAGFAAYYGLQAIARAGGVAVGFVVLSILLAGVALLPQMEAVHFPPLLYDGWSPVVSGALEDTARSLEVAVIGLLLPRIQGSATKGYLWWCGLFTGVALVIQTSVVGVLGDFGEMERFPYYTVITTIGGSALQRMDMIAAAIWVGALFLRTAFFGALAADSLQSVCGDRFRAVIVAGESGLVLLGGLLLFGRLPLETEQAVLWYIAAGILLLAAVVLPLALAIGERARRVRRKRESCPPKERVTP